MSTRTIIEINHDELHRLIKSPHDFVDLVKTLCGSEITGALNRGEKPYFGSGLYVLAQRHHSEKLTLEII